ncbi:hypothetical protein AB205_0182810 [Aquarana catesbeiana]|uniref:Uncharacterized protein n=1 Tax=Aquarana catesbeiana TaxID=8400 RepID=A0A2G9NXV7_AQUCT|nr:hypothetical protein AB205_0182810 [Aquarana catesbeiana]
MSNVSVYSISTSAVLPHCSFLHLRCFWVCLLLLMYFCLVSFQGCLSIPDIKTAFSDCINKIGKRDCLTQACSALSGRGVNEGVEWMVKCVVRNIHRPPRQKDIT